MQVGGTVGCLDTSGFDAWHLVAFVGAFCCQQVGGFFEILGIYQVDNTWLVFRGITVDKISTGCVKYAAVLTFLTLAEWLVHLSVAGIYCKVATFQAFDSGEDNVFTFGIEAEDVFYQPIAFGQLSYLVELLVCSACCRGMYFGIRLGTCIKEV